MHWKKSSDGLSDELALTKTEDLKYGKLRTSEPKDGASRGILKTVSKEISDLADAVRYEALGDLLFEKQKPSYGDKHPYAPTRGAVIRKGLRGEPMSASEKVTWEKIADAHYMKKHDDQSDAYDAWTANLDAKIDVLEYPTTLLLILSTISILYVAQYIAKKTTKKVVDYVLSEDEDENDESSRVKRRRK